jgi:ABC-2 type transport system permease protein
MNIYLHELKTSRRSLIIWIISLCGLMGLMMCFYPLVKNDMDTYMELMNNFPPAMKAVLGVMFEDFTSAVGFYGFIFTYITLAGAIQAMNLGVSIVSKEEREKTADFLMTKPVSRPTIMTAKVVAAFSIFLITNIIYSCTTYFVMLALSGKDLDLKRLLLFQLALILMQLVFFSIGLCVTAFMKKVRAVLPISLGMVFSFFAISALAVTSAEDKLRYITPFQYFTAKQIMKEASFEPSFLIISAVIVCLGIAISYFRYIHKNIHAV